MAVVRRRLEVRARRASAALVALLVLATASACGRIPVTGYSDRRLAETQMRNIGDRIEFYKTRRHSLPATLDDLSTQVDDVTHETNIRRSPVARDPWGTAYRYRILDARRMT